MTRTKAQAQKDTAVTMAISEVIQPLLHGQARQVQGGVLADLLSLWLAGHVIIGDREATDELRHQLLDDLVATVWKLVPASEQEIMSKIEPEGSA